MVRQKVTKLSRFLTACNSAISDYNLRKLNIEFITRAEGVMLDTSTSYLLASDWCISNETEGCRGVRTSKMNCNEEYHLPDFAFIDLKTVRRNKH